MGYMLLLQCQQPPCSPAASYKLISPIRRSTALRLKWQPSPCASMYMKRGRHVPWEAGQQVQTI